MSSNKDNNTMTNIFDNYTAPITMHEIYARLVGGQITEDEVCKQYGITKDELHIMLARYQTY